MRSGTCTGSGAAHSRPAAGVARDRDVDPREEAAHSGLVGSSEFYILAVTYWPERVEKC